MKVAKKVILTAKQRDLLEKMEKSTHGGQHFKKRATIILKAADGESNKGISKIHNINRGVVRMWRDHWVKATKEINQIELEKPHKLSAKIKDVLSDEYRCRKPTVFTPEQVS